MGFWGVKFSILVIQDSCMGFETKIKELLKIGIVKESELCDLNSLEDDSVYRQFYNFFYNLIGKMTVKHGISPVYFFIDGTLTCSSKSTFKNGIYLIKISQGYPKVYHDILFKRNTFSLNPKIQELYGKLINSNGFDLNEFFLHSSMNFTFYHEFRHLLQSNGKEFNFSENSTNTTFNSERHILEFDADRIGIRHVMDYAFDNFETLSDKSPANLKSLLILSIGSVVVTFLLYEYKALDVYNPIPKEPEEFYLEERTHPHTLVRLAHVFEFYAENVKVNYPDLNIDLVDVLKYSLEIAEIFFSDNFEVEIVRNYINEFALNLDKINSYNQKLFDDSLKNTRIKELMQIYAI